MDSAYDVPVNNDKANKVAQKEKSDRRKRLDAEDRNKIREELKKHINRISSEQKHQINIMISRNAPSEVNVDNDLANGEHMPQLQTFIASLPGTILRQIKKEVVTMEQLKKKGRDVNIYDMEKLNMQAYSLFLNVETSIFWL